MDALKAIFTKRDTRTFTAEPVDAGVLRSILQAGRMAGSAKNTQPCRFIVVADAGRKEELAACGQFSAWIPQAPVNIAVVMPPEGRDFDAGRAAQNIMVATNAHGLVSCPVTMHDQECARRALGLPDGHQVAIVIAIGHPPDGEITGLGATRNALEDIVHHERWSP